MDEIFYLARHGEGFGYFDCYNMPIQIRKYNVRKLNFEISQENERLEAAKKGEKTSGLDQLVRGPSPTDAKNKPDYVTKASRR